MSNLIPLPIRQVLDTFTALANHPQLYQASVEALYLSTMELAAEIGPCPSCGADTAIPPTRYPLRIALCPCGSEYCEVCGTPAIEQVIPESFRDELGRDTRYEPDWDAISKYRND